MLAVAVTGATGEVARGVLPLLEQQFDLTLLSVDPPAGDSRHRRADILDLHGLTEAFRGAAAVLHLAVATGHSGTFEDDDFNDRRFDVNVKGAHHVFEAARRAGVRRVVHVSSLMVVWGYGSEGGVVAGDAAASPVGTYALTKALSEEVARYHAQRGGLEVIVVRIAAPFDPADPNLKRLRPQQVPYADLARAFALALTVPLTRFEIVTVVGESCRRAWDLETARRVLGYQPTVRLDDLGVEWAEPFDVA